jgi:Zn-finger nucleic acid-binding protein
MKCPACKTPDLLMTERQAIEIDYCPACRGVWLDRGELDKLIARADDARPAGRDAARAPSLSPSAARHDDWGQRGSAPRDGGHAHSGYRKKKSLFDLFDFD